MIKNIIINFWLSWKYTFSRVKAFAELYQENYNYDNDQN